MRESATASHITLYAAYAGALLWRNNVGVAITDNGRHVRYGLCNETAKMNKEIKSSDWIGITPVLITPEMVGKTVGLFTAIETKPSDWKLNTACDRTLAQGKFHDIVRQAGGFAGFARDVEEFKRITGL